MQNISQANKQLNENKIMHEDTKQTLVITAVIGGFIVAGIGLLFAFFAIYAKYNVWSSSLAGEAELKRAEWNRQIAVREAQAKKDAAIMLAQAEVERAKGVAAANKIIGDSLKGNEDYLRYLWIEDLQHTQDKIIYVPTEANLPILEANRLPRQKTATTANN